MDYKGVIIEESLVSKEALQDLTVLKTRREKVTPKHKTPWLTQWTLHTVKIPANDIDIIATELSKSIEVEHPSWYIDFKNDKFHFIIFPNKVFKVDVDNPVGYKSAREYGLTLGIPIYQMTFERLKR